MKTLVIGAGGVGGSFGAMLQQAGAEVAFVARGAHAEAMRRDGLRILRPNGEVHLRPVQVRALGEAPEPFDVILVTVKMYDLEPVAAALLPYLGPETAVIPLQNGIEAPERLARFLPPAQVCPGVARIGAAIAAPGCLRVTTPFAVLRFGERSGVPSARLERFAALCRQAGIDAAQVTDIDRELWAKFVFLAPFATITAYAQRPIGVVREDSELWALFERLLAEASAVARAHHAPLASDFEAKTRAFVQGLPSEMTSSMATDLETGRRLELDWLTGAVMRLGRKAGVAVPETERLYAALKPYRDGDETARR